MKKHLLFSLLFMGFIACGDDSNTTSPSTISDILSSSSAEGDFALSSAANEDVYSSSENLGKPCGDNFYDPQEEFCYKGAVYALCNGESFAPNTEFCKNGILLDLCEGNEFNPDSSFCMNNKLFKKCNGMEYNPETEFCYETLSIICTLLPWEDPTLYPSCTVQEDKIWRIPIANAYCLTYVKYTL